MKNLAIPQSIMLVLCFMCIFLCIMDDWKHGFVGFLAFVVLFMLLNDGELL